MVPRIAGMTLLAAILLCPIVSLGGTWRHDLLDGDSTHTDLAADPAYDAVGLLLGKTFLCSGTLIDADWVVSAAHCLDRGKASHYTFDLGGDDRTGAEKFVHPDWTGSVAGGSDVALLRLNSPFDTTVVPPANLATAVSLPAQIVSVGFGQGGDGLTGASGSAGTKRAGYNQIEQKGSFFGWSDTILLNDFDKPLNGTFDPAESTFPAPIEDLEFNVAPGDSGGAMFIAGELAGVTSLGWASDGNVNSDYGDGGGFTDLTMFNDWIDGVLDGGGADDGGGGGGPPPGRGRPFGFTGGSARTLTSPVPEASSGTLVTVALLALAWARRRRAPCGAGG